MTDEPGSDPEDREPSTATGRGTFLAGRRRWLLLAAALAVVAASTAVAVEQERDVRIDVAGQPVADEEVAFAADTDPPDFGERFTWRIDGERMDETERFRHVFGESGDHDVAIAVVEGNTTLRANVSVEVSDPSDGQATASQTDTSATAATDAGPGGSRSPVVSTVPSSATVGEVVRFAPTGAADAASYRWTIGETTMSTNRSFRHMFHRPGRYDVTLTRTGGDGATTTEQYEVTVTDRPDEPDRVIQLAPRRPSVGDDVAIGAATEVTDRATDMTWHVDGEQVADRPRFRYSFRHTGPVNLSMTATTRKGVERHRRVIAIDNGSTASED